MISKNSIYNIVRKLHLDSFIESHKECLRDNRGAFLIPIEVKITDEEYQRYRHLPIDWSLSPITHKDLPEDFSEKAVKTVDMFRRKTHNLDIECMIYFDIETGNIVSCNFSDDDFDKVEGIIFPECLKGMHIASLHNHPFQYYSPPSGKNFEMLGLDFEEYELILSNNELWILESKETILDSEIIGEIRNVVDESFESFLANANVELNKGYHVIDNVNRDYGIYLLNYLNSEFDNIKLIKVDLDE